jgi:hypothetical protein
VAATDGVCAIPSDPIESMSKVDHMESRYIDRILSLKTDSMITLSF